MSLSLYIYENVFCLLFFGFLVFYFCTALWVTMVVLFCAIEINEMKLLKTGVQYSSDRDRCDWVVMEPG